MATSRIDQFIEFKIELIPKETIPLKDRLERPVKISLGEPINPKTLPYSDIFTDEVVSSYNVERINRCMIFARGDSRSPQEIYDVGGFHPQITSKLVHNKRIYERHVLNLFSHRASTANSGFVSCTSSLRAALRFGSEGRIQKDGDIYVYFVKVVGAFSPERVPDKEYEYSVVGGIDADDIVAYRKLEKGIRTDSKSVFVSKEFIKKYPDKLEEILKAFTYPDESYSASLRAFKEDLEDEKITPIQPQPRPS